MSARTPHPFQPGDRIIWEPETVTYGYKRYAHRLHCVERAWTTTDSFHPLHMIKLIGIEKPTCANQFRLMARPGAITA